MAGEIREQCSSSSYLDLDDPFHTGKQDPISTGSLDSCLSSSGSDAPFDREPGECDDEHLLDISNEEGKRTDSSESSRIWDDAVKPVAIPEIRKKSSELKKPRLPGWIRDLCEEEANLSDGGYEDCPNDDLKQRSLDLLSIQSDELFMVPRDALFGLIRSAISIAHAHQQIYNSRQNLIGTMQDIHATERSACLTLLNSLSSEPVDGETKEVIMEMKRMVESLSDDMTKPSNEDHSLISSPPPSRSASPPVVPDVTRPPPPISSVPCTVDTSQPPPPIPSMLSVPPPAIPHRGMGTPPIKGVGFSPYRPYGFGVPPPMVMTTPPPFLPPRPYSACLSGPPSYYQQRRRTFNGGDGRRFSGMGGRPYLGSRKESSQSPMGHP